MATYTHHEVPGSPIGPWFSQRFQSYYAQGENEFVLYHDDNTVTHLRGKDFSNDGARTAGTVESLTRTSRDGAVTYETVTGLNVTLASILDVSAPPRLLVTKIFAGSDIFAGWSGGDVFQGGPGADGLNGAGGFDWADYHFASRGVRADLAGGTGNSGDADGDRFNGVEGLIGTDFDDQLRGDATYNSLIGGAGNDVLAGRGSGDRLEGGAGQDWADYSGASSAVTLDLATGAGTAGEAAGDLFIGIENVRGTTRNDRLTGDDGNNVLRGDLGADRLNGRAGYDTADYRGAGSAVIADLLTPAANTGEAKGDSYTAIENLRGTDFNDKLSGNADGNWLEGGAGADALSGRGGYDLASYLSATGSVVADLSAPSRNSGQAKGDSYVSIEGLVGSRFNDALIGNAGNNLLHGGGSETIPKGGEDGGLDWFDGRGGFDTVSFRLQQGSVYADLTKNSNMAAKQGDIFISIEAVVGSDYNDRIFGSARADTIRGENGDDEIVGGVGADTLAGGKGNDRFNVDNVRDVVQELAGEGTDTLVTSALTTVSLNRYANVENLTFTGTANARLTGEETTNVIEGGIGNDIIDGGRGVDIMKGGKGNDIYYVDFEGDRVEELKGAGIDTVYSSISLQLVANVEKGVLTGNANLDLTGNELSNELTGNAGDNQLNGGWTAEADVLIGKGGNDSYWVSAGDRVVEAAGGGIDTVNTYLARSALADNVENLTFLGYEAFTATGNKEANTITGQYNNDTISGGAGNDTLNGNGGDDILNGEAGNDVLDGSWGNDKMNGGAGNDSYVVDSLQDVVIEVVGGGTDTVTTSISYALGTYANNLTLVGQVNGTGNIFENVLTGSEYANRLDGGLGADRLIGAAGNDTLAGGGGADVFVFRPGFGHDTITDFLLTGVGHDVIEFGDGVFANAAQLFASSTDTAKGVLVSVDGGNSLLIEDVKLAQLRAHPEDFAFHV